MQNYFEARKQRNIFLYHTYPSHSSMTSLFAHKVAQPTKYRFLTKNLSQLVIFVIGLAFTWVWGDKNRAKFQKMNYFKKWSYQLCNCVRQKWGHANNDTPNTSPWCGGGAWSWPTWAQTISMASCLINNSGNSANTDSIRQAKEQSYPWTNK